MPIYEILIGDVVSTGSKSRPSVTVNAAIAINIEAKDASDADLQADQLAHRIGAHGYCIPAIYPGKIRKKIVVRSKNRVQPERGSHGTTFFARRKSGQCADRRATSQH